jgi:UDP-glucuronate 4-epimerase
MIDSMQQPGRRSMRMRILVTGGVGFIGSHLCSRLLCWSRTERVTIVDSLDPYYDPGRKRERLTRLTASQAVAFHEADILDGERMEAIFAEASPEVVVHLAALPGVRGSLARPLSYVEVDVKGTVQILELCRKHGVRGMIFASSSSVYGEKPLNRPFREEDGGLFAASPYAASKLSAEVFCRTYHHLYDLSVTALRFFTVYGPEQRPDMAISRFVEQLMHDRPLTVYDPQSVRDYTYVDDIVEGILLAIEKLGGWQVYNLGSGKPTSLADLLDLLEQVTGRKGKREYAGKQPGDVSGTWADIHLATSRLGWRPRVELREGLERFYRWWVSR